jgi:hypothetical protein
MLLGNHEVGVRTITKIVHPHTLANDKLNERSHNRIKLHGDLVLDFDTSFVFSVS